VRLSEFGGHWLASADTPAGLSLARGASPLSAAIDALEPFDGYVDDLIWSGPPELFD
jgi:hypothetical protein